MKEITLVTGATGFVGQYLLARLLADGQRVRVYVRRPEKLRPGVRSRLEIVTGDLSDRDSLQGAVRGAHTVLHLAACAQAWARDSSVFERANVRAVEWLLDAAERTGVRRLVHVSTALTLPLADQGEADFPRRSITPYERTKLEGERLVEAYARRGHHGVIVHPTRVYGPGPMNDANGVTRVVDLYMRGRFRLRIDDGDVRANYVHAEDVATGIRLAAERGRPGAHYVLGGPDSVSFGDFLELVARIGGTRRRVLAIPPVAAIAVAHAARAWGRLGGRTSLTPEWVRVFLSDLPFDVARARSDLGYEPRDLARGLAETIAWLRTADRMPAEAGESTGEPSDDRSATPTALRERGVLT
jgi:farnesol dehydrogenase